MFTVFRTVFRNRTRLPSKTRGVIYMAHGRVERDRGQGTCVRERERERGRDRERGRESETDAETQW